MLLIVDGNQIVYPNIEGMMTAFREMGGVVAMVMVQGVEPIPEAILKTRVIHHNVDAVIVIVEDSLENRCKLYRDFIGQVNVGPEDTTIISNSGQDLAVAILIGCEFTFAMDYA